MSIVHNPDIRNELTDLVVDHIDDGTVQDAGIIVIKQISPPLDLVSINFANRTGAGGPGAFGDAAAGIATANSLPIEGQVVNTGTAQTFTISDCSSPRTEICSGTVSNNEGEGDIKLSSVDLTENDYVRLTALTYESSN